MTNASIKNAYEHICSKHLMKQLAATVYQVYAYSLYCKHFQTGRYHHQILVLQTIRGYGSIPYFVTNSYYYCIAIDFL